MAGRILPVALATVIGISIGVATFDPEFKEQRRRRLQEEYEKEVAAAAAMNNQAAPSNTASTLAHTSIQPPSTPSSQPTSSWSSLLGLWAWKKGETPQNQDNLEGKGKP